MHVQQSDYFVLLAIFRQFLGFCLRVSVPGYFVLRREGELDQYRVVDGAVEQGAPLWTEPNWRGIGAEVGGSEGEKRFFQCRAAVFVVLLLLLLLS